MYWWCVAAFSSSLWNIPTPIHQVLDGRIVQTHIKIDAFCEQWWWHEQHPGKKSGHMLHLLCHKEPLGTVCSRTQITCASGHATTYTTTPPVRPFLQQGGDVLFSRTTHVHIWLLHFNLLLVVYNCPGQQDPQIFCQLKTYGTWWSRNLLFLQSLPQPLLNCNNGCKCLGKSITGCKMLGKIYRRMIFIIFMAVYMWEYMPELPPAGVHCVLLKMSGHPLLWHVSHLVWIYHHILL